MYPLLAQAFLQGMGIGQIAIYVVVIAAIVALV